MNDLQTILEISSSRHTHLCPRQVLGARIGIKGGQLLGLDLPRKDKRLLIILETDGCFADGVESATGCTLGHRTLRVEDYGKVAATFIDVKTNQAVRLVPKLDVRKRAFQYAADETRRYFAQLHAYQVMPDDELLEVTPVLMNVSVKDIISRAGVRVNCENCGEEILNEREILLNEQTFCRPCALGGYYRPQLVFEASKLLYEQSVK